MQTLVHVKAMEISGRGIVQTEGLKVPFLWFVRVVTPCYVLPLESDRHLIYVEILIANEVAGIHRGMVRYSKNSHPSVFF